MNLRLKIKEDMRFKLRKNSELFHNNQTSRSSLLKSSNSRVSFGTFQNNNVSDYGTTAPNPNYQTPNQHVASLILSQTRDEQKTRLKEEMSF